MPDSSPYRFPNEEELQEALGRSEKRSTTDCPSEATLRQLVTGALAKDEPFLSAVLEHLADCPDCEATLRKIRTESLHSPSLRPAVIPGQHRSLWLSACLVLVIAALAAVLFLKIRARTPETVTVDLRLVTRGAEASSLPAITLHRRLVQIRVVLPRNKPDGEYTLGIFRSPQDGPPLLTQAGSAVIQDDNTSVHASFSLEKLPSGTYFVGIREGPSPWSYYPFTLD